ENASRARIHAFVARRSVVDRRESMEIVDSQIHEPSPPKRLDPEKYDAETRLLIDVELAREAIDSVGIDAALCFATQEFCDAATQRYPDRFAGAVPFDAYRNDDDLEERVANHRK